MMRVKEYLIERIPEGYEKQTKVVEGKNHIFLTSEQLGTLIDNYEIRCALCGVERISQNLVKVSFQNKVVHRNSYPVCNRIGAQNDKCMFND
jgi:hypothetical protein